MNDNIRKIIISTGGTGGHVFAALPVVQELLKQHVNMQVITDTRGLKYLETIKSQVPIHVLYMEGLGKQSLLKKLYGGFFLLAATIATFIKFIHDRPTMVIGFGGHATFPAVLAAVLLRIPVILHEQNSVLGKVNRLLSRFAKIVCTSFQNTLKVPTKAKIIYTGMPIRFTVTPKKSDKFTLFIMGGSQGSNIFSEVIPEAIKLLPSKNIKIIQQCRAESLPNVKRIYDELQIEYELAEFFYAIPEILSKTDLVISRSGSGSVNEIAGSKIPAIYVPYPYASDNHQYYNAKAICDIDGGWLIEQKDFTIERLTDLLSKLINKPMILSEFSANLRRVSVASATDNIIKVIREHI